MRKLLEFLLVFFVAGCADRVVSHYPPPRDIALANLYGAVFRGPCTEQAEYFTGISADGERLLVTFDKDTYSLGVEYYMDNTCAGEPSLTVSLQGEYDVSEDATILLATPSGRVFLQSNTQDFVDLMNSINLAGYEWVLGVAHEVPVGLVNMEDDTQFKDYTVSVSYTELTLDGVVLERQ